MNSSTPENDGAVISCPLRVILDLCRNAHQCLRDILKEVLILLK